MATKQIAIRLDGEKWLKLKMAILQDKDIDSIQELLEKCVDEYLKSKGE